MDTHNVGRYENVVWYICSLNKDEIVTMTITVKTLAVGNVGNVVVVKSEYEILKSYNTFNNIKYIYDLCVVWASPAQTFRAVDCYFGVVGHSFF